MNFSEFLYFKTLPDEGMQVCRRSMSIRYLEMRCVGASSGMPYGAASRPRGSTAPRLRIVGHPMRLARRLRLHGTDSRRSLGSVTEDEEQQCCRSAWPGLRRAARLLTISHGSGNDVEL